MSAAETGRPLGLGIVGLGGAAVNMMPAFRRSPHFNIKAVADLDVDVLDRFWKDQPEAETMTEVERLCAHPDVDLVFIGTPNRLHSEHAHLALTHGKHVLIEKPMAVTLEDAEEMIRTAEANGVLLGVNVKHSFEPRIRKIREIARSRALGGLRMIHNWRYVDWLYRPRSAEELTPGWGNGLLWRQGPHQLDIIRTIGGGMLRSVRGMTGTWDTRRRVTGAYAAYLEFEENVCATVVCSAYDHFDSRALVYGFDGVAPMDDPERHARARRELAHHDGKADWEARAAGAERYGGGRRSTQASAVPGQSGGWILGGPLIASFDHGDVRLSPSGLIVDADDRQWEIPMPREPDGRDRRLESFFRAITEETPLVADGRWGKATQEVLVALERSAATHTEVTLHHQVPAAD